jgi:replicative DNA helicase
MDSDPKSLPFSETMEKGVLCSLWRDAEMVSELCRRQLQPDAFTSPGHRIVYQLLLEFAAQRQSTDFRLVQEALKGRLNSVVGEVSQFLNEIYTFVTTAANAQFYIDGLREKWAARLHACPASVVLPGSARVARAS